MWLHVHREPGHSAVRGAASKRGHGVGGRRAAVRAAPACCAPTTPAAPALPCERSSHPCTGAWVLPRCRNRPDLELELEALAVTYVWVFTINGPQLAAAINKFPRSGARLQAVRERWILRRAMVRHAERISHERGHEFRGRLMPIYAKEIRRQQNSQRARAEPTQTIRVSRLEAAGVRRKRTSPTVARFGWRAVLVAAHTLVANRSRSRSRDRYRCTHVHNDQ